MRLEPASHRFFQILSEIVFLNPFGVQRSEVERLATASTRVAQPRRGEHHFKALVPAVDAELEQLAGRGVCSLDDIDANHRLLLKHAFLFQSYHRHVEQFDALIRAQLRTLKPDVDVDFADVAITELRALGFRADEASHYFALFYQLRRAYYFIARALVGDSQPMRHLREALWNNVFSHDVRVYDQALWPRMEDFSTLLLGETGTGKGAAAEAVGRSGYIPFDVRRRQFVASFTESFTSTNLSQFPESLIESELFGHRKGAFTGAVDDHEGVFARCREYGTLFLDEIGDVSVSVQLKLLRVLQERVFTPVGSHQQQRFAGRVIAATNQPLADLRRSGRFRDDFFYRLCSDVVTVPSLRTRLTDTPGELESLVRLLVRRTVGTVDAELVELVMTTLERDLPADYSWPGNVRELEQAVRRVLLTRSYVAHVDTAAGAEDELAAEFRGGTLTASELLSRYCAALYAELGSYDKVARKVALDRRTVRKYVQARQ